MAIDEHVRKCMWLISLYPMMTDGIKKNFIPEKDDLYFTQLNYAGDYTAMSETVAKGVMLSPTIENSLVTNI